MAASSFYTILYILLIQMHLNIDTESFLIIVGVFFFYQDIFFLTDVSRTGTLSLSELRNALVASGRPVRIHL